MHSSGIRTIRCSVRGGVSVQGVSAWGGLLSGGGEVHHPCPLWTEFLTHACENITFPQLLLRTVNIISFVFGTY